MQLFKAEKLPEILVVGSASAPLSNHAHPTKLKQSNQKLMASLWTSTAHGGFSSVRWWIVLAINNYRCREQHFVLYKTKCKPKTISNFYSQPQLADGRRWTFWQYTERGRVTGVPTLVDHNVFNGSKEQFKELLSDNLR